MAIELEQWLPMPWQMGPPLPQSMEIYWPWYTPPEVLEEAVPPPEVPPPPVGYHTLLIYIVGLGVVTPGSGNYPAGSVVTLTAIPDSDYVFDHWSGDLSGTNPTANITMYRDRLVTAYFKAAPPPEEVPPPPPEEVPPPPPPPGVADIKVEDLTIEPTEVYVGESVSISVTATNYGDASGSQVITCDVNGKASKQTVELSPGESRQISFEAIPQQAKTYQVSVNGLTGSFVASEVPPAPPATGMITLYGTGFDVKGTDWNWLASWHYADGTTGYNIDDYYGWRGPNDACTPAKPIPLNNLVFSITVGSYEYGYSGLGSFGPFKVEDGKTYVIDVKTRKLSQR